MKRLLSRGGRSLVFMVSLVGAASPSPAPARLSAVQIVRARQAAYGLSAGTFGEMKMVIDTGADVKPLAFGSNMLARWARTLPTMFPNGSNLAPTNARPEVWTKRAEFNQRAQAYADAAAKLAEVAKSGDKSAFAAQWSAVRGTCSACHDDFRKK